MSAIDQLRELGLLPEEVEDWLKPLPPLGLGGVDTFKRAEDALNSLAAVAVNQAKKYQSLEDEYRDASFAELNSVKARAEKAESMLHLAWEWHQREQPCNCGDYETFRSSLARQATNRL